MASRTWTDEERNYVRDNYEALGRVAVARHLKRTKNAVAIFASMNGIAQPYVKKAQKTKAVKPIERHDRGPGRGHYILMVVSDELKDKVEQMKRERGTYGGKQ